MKKCSSVKEVSYFYKNEGSKYQHDNLPKNNRI